MVGDFIEAGRRGAQDARDEFDAVSVPLVRVGDAVVVECGRHGGFVDPEEAGVLGEMPVREIHSFAVFA